MRIEGGSLDCSCCRSWARGTEPRACPAPTMQSISDRRQPAWRSPADRGVSKSAPRWALNGLHDSSCCAWRRASPPARAVLHRDVSRGDASSAEGRAKNCLQSYHQRLDGGNANRPLTGFRVRCRQAGQRPTGRVSTAFGNLAHRRGRSTVSFRQSSVASSASHFQGMAVTLLQEGDW